MGKQKLFGGFIATPCFGIDFGRFGGPVLYSFWGDLGVVLGHLIAGQGPSNNPLMYLVVYMQWAAVGHTYLVQHRLGTHKGTL